MKLLVFAHTPPPHHGQSYMVQLMLAGLGGDRRKARAPATLRGESGAERMTVGGDGADEIECYHVNARLSQNLEDIGDLRVGKFILLLGYCLQAIWCRFCHGVTNFYYIPAPGKPSALYRDWLVMLICRPFFKRVILHWHAAGLAKWLEMVVQMRSRSLTYRLMKQVDLSIVLSRYNQADAEKLFSRRIKVVSNGIPDPCPAFLREVLPRRRVRCQARQKLASGQPLTVHDLEGTGGDSHIIKVLYLAHCTFEKGLFDTLSAVRLANEKLVANRSPLTLRLLIAGTFVSAAEKQAFEQVMAQPGVAAAVQHFGFVSGEQKNELLRDADLFCFPTYYQNENQPVNLIEAMAYGLPIVTTKWRSIPELFPANYPGLVEVRSPSQLADAMLRLPFADTGEGFRDIFTRNFTLERHLASLQAALRSLDQAQTEPLPGVPVSVSPHG